MTTWCSFPVQSLNPVRLVGLAAGEKIVCIKRICLIGIAGAGNDYDTLLQIPPENNLC